MLYKPVHYGVNHETGCIDYDQVAELAEQHHPKLIVAGASCYPRIIDFPRLRAIADSVGARLMVDMFEETLYSLDTAFDDWLSEPNQVAFAIVEEFVDRVLRAEDVHAEWRFFFYSVRSQIWPSEFQELGEHSQLRRQWETAVERASAANLPGGFQFLN